MILGTGVDQITIARIGSLLNRFEARFLKRVFTAAEQAYCNAAPNLRVARYAKRFAAKEALLKALGTGYRRGISWQDIEVCNDLRGQPQVHLSGHTQVLLLQKLPAACTYRIHLSLSDTATDALAFVVLEAVNE
jgi:holo-[acyl-carrier protein] synthase